FYSKTKQGGNHVHEYYLIDGLLVCIDGDYTRSLEGYTGFVKTLDGNLMYFIGGQLYKGLLLMGSDKYYFNDETGYAHTGELDIWGLIAVFDDNGKLVSGGTGFVKDGSITRYYRNLELHK